MEACAKCKGITQLDSDRITKICKQCGNIDYTLTVQNGRIGLEDLFGRIDRLLRRNIDGKNGS